MNKIIEEKLSTLREEANTERHIQEERKYREIIRENKLYKKSYSPNDKYSDEYSLKDAKGKFYKNEEISVNESNKGYLNEINQLNKELRSYKNMNNSSALKSFMFTISMLFYVLAFIVFLIGLDIHDWLLTVVSVITLVITGTLFLSLSTIIKLLQEINDKKT